MPCSILVKCQVINFPISRYLGHDGDPLSVDSTEHSVVEEDGEVHSEGESLRKGEKKRLGRRSSPQNGRFGGRATSCECSEEQTIDQARILGRPDNSLL